MAPKPKNDETPDEATDVVEAPVEAPPVVLESGTRIGANGELELVTEPTPWDVDGWPTGATVRYLGPDESVELPYRTDDGVMLYRTVERGGTLEVSPELAASLAERDDFEEA